MKKSQHEKNCKKARAVMCNFLLFSCAVFFLSACAKKAPAAGNFAYSQEKMSDMRVSDDADYGYARAGGQSYPGAPNADGVSGAGYTQAQAERKLKFRADVTLRLTDLEKAAKMLDEFTKKYGSYSAATSAYENSREYELKVPAASYRLFLDELLAMGKVIEYSEDTEDVTLQYYDLESRLSVKRELLSTYRSYLARAKSIEEILAVEKQISELQGEIDRTGTQFRALTSAIDYATIYLTFELPFSPTNSGNLSVAERITELFSSFTEFVSGFLLVLVGIVIYGTPILAVLLLLYWLLFGKIGALKKLFALVSEKK
ncbi:MAG: hypothetical protein Ta2A_13560 [Treponemataceae bacterium]|nr:MAG: hypothetical protein Ta2A_13560 [Treponemataceae bacterium]